MPGTPDWLKDKIRSYFQQTTERSYLAKWSMEALAFHYGLADETTATLADAHNNSNRYVADALGLKEGMRVLDAGCGVGGTSIWMATHRGVKMVGLTLDPGQVVLGTKLAHERGVSDRVELLEMDFAATSFPAASFDAAFNIESVCQCADVPAYARHVLDLLKDDAQYGCLDFFVGEGQADLVEEVKTGWVMPNWLAIDAVASAFERVGFVEVTTVDLTAQVRRSAEQLLATASNSLLVARLDGAVGVTQDPIFQGHLRAAVACSQGLLGGGVKYGFIGARRPRR